MIKMNQAEKDGLIDVRCRGKELTRALLVCVCRFGGGSIVVHAPSKVKVARSGRELQLPSMAQLTSKMSSQHFLLRILKVSLADGKNAAMLEDRNSVKIYRLRESQDGERPSVEI
jgi:hypothetical protein